MTRLRTTGLRTTTGRLRTTTTAGSVIATALVAEDDASAPGAIIGPAACVCELATRSPAPRAAANVSATGADFIVGPPFRSYGRSLRFECCPDHERNAVFWRQCRCRMTCLIPARRPLKMSTLYVREQATLWSMSSSNGCRRRGQKEATSVLGTAYPLPNGRIWHFSPIRCAQRRVRS